MITNTQVLESSWGIYSDLIQTWTEKAKKTELLKRIYAKEAAVWTNDSAGQKEIANRLGWIDAPSRMKSQVKDIISFAGSIKDEGFTHVVLLGMGGSSLAPELFADIFGSRRNFPELLVLDSTDPERIKDIEQKVDLQKTLFIVSSKSGGTIELVSLYKYFFDKVSQVFSADAGKRFVAITDPGSPLEKMAKDSGFRKVFQGFSDVGGRFSALTAFGLVPAALIGVDIQKVLDSAAKVNPESALELGLAMAVLAEEGRDKLTLVTSKSLHSFGDWAEQLVAESTGKEEMGIIPIVRESVGSPLTYENDRFFVTLLLEKDKDPKHEAKLSEIYNAKHPILVNRLVNLEDIGGEFWKWEMATAIACALLKVNAFDQPDVQSAKENTKTILKTLETTGQIEVPEPALSEDRFWASFKKGDYCAVLAFLPEREELRKKLIDFQTYLREKTKLATTLGIGPRYLHSTGQLHKGGPNNGVFVVITAAHANDLAVPGEKYTFGQLETAQGLGDFETLQLKGRRVLHYALVDASADELARLTLKIKNDVRKYFIG